MIAKNNNQPQNINIQITVKKETLGVSVHQEQRSFKVELQ